MRPSVQVASILAVGVIGLGAAVSIYETSGDTPATSSSPSKAPEKSERDDLLSFRLEDRSSSGIADFWVGWQIRNHSSEKSNYTFDWEAVDTNTGKRVGYGTEYENNVLPGQTAVGDMFTTLKTSEHVKLNITDFDRTKAY